MKTLFTIILVLVACVNVFAQDSLNVTLVGTYDTPDRAWGVAVAGSFAYVADVNSGLRIIDVSLPEAPMEVGFFLTEGSAFSVALSGDYAYVTDLSISLRVLDVSNPALPFEVGFFDAQSGFNAYGVTVEGSYAYLANYLTGLRIINIENPAIPWETGFFDTPGEALDVEVRGNLAYVADNGHGLRIIDVSNPASPQEIGFYDAAVEAHAIAVNQNYVYVADGVAGLRIIDVTNPTEPIEVGIFDTPSYAVDVVISGSYAYVADNTSGLRIINIANSAAPTEAGYYDTPCYANAVEVSGNYIYVGDSDCGLEILSFPGLAPAAEIMVNYPNGGESFRIAIPETIEWVSAVYTGDVRLEINRSFPSSDWEVISARTANDGTETWLATGPSSINCRVRVSAVDDTISDMSDSNFSIISFLDLTYPNVGATLNVYQADTVRWSSGGLNSVSIQLNRHYPLGPWEMITDSTENDGEYEWFVTDPLSDSCRIRICALQDTFCDVSDGNFSIVSSQGYLGLIRSSAPSTPVTAWNTGDVECPNAAGQTFRIKNFGSEPIVVFQPLEPTSAEFSRTTTCGSFFALAPGGISTCSLTVSFTPNSEGTFYDTLRIQTDAVNGINGFVYIPLSGTQIRTPESPEVVISTIGNNAVLRWSPIVESIGHCQIDPPSYLVFFSEDPDGPFWFHGGTNDTTYTHVWAIQYTAAMFYHVYAVQADPGLLASLPGWNPDFRISEADIIQRFILATGR